jgi:hypothetical protein
VVFENIFDEKFGEKNRRFFIHIATINAEKIITTIIIIILVFKTLGYLFAEIGENRQKL